MMHRMRRWLRGAGRAGLALLLGVAGAGCVSPPEGNPYARLLENMKPGDRPAITAGEIRAHVRYLASDELKGREAGTRECTVAAYYIAQQFVKAGLEEPPESAYFQSLAVSTVEGIGKANRLEFGKGDQKRTCSVKKEFVPLGMSANGQVSGGAVFAGYGISAPEHEYDDYAGIDAKGKIVLLLRYEPGEDDADSPFDGKKHTRHAYFVTKIRLAAKAGAAGVLIVTGPRYHAGDPDKLPALQKQILATEELPVAFVKRNVADDLLGLAGKRLADLQDGIDDRMKPNSFALEGVNLTLHTQVVHRRRKTYNVIGLLPGSDPKLKDQYVVVGAHYDHLGLGEFGSASHGSEVGEVHNGADDNASGTAAVLEIAEYLASRPERPRRSILFMAFTGEEKGLVGSTYYVKHPLVPLDKTVAMINLDMVGRLRKDQLTISGVGTSPGFKELVKRANREKKLKIKYVEGGNSPSDSTAFYTKKIPVLFFFTGIHADYHRKSDDWQKINAAGEARVAQVAAETLLSIADAQERPKFVRNDGGFAYGDPGQPRLAWFGIMPEIYSEQNNGVVVLGVTEHSPADEGGVREDDRIVKMGQMTIRNLQDMTTFLSSHKPGEMVKVRIVRGDKETALNVTLGRRP